MTSEEKIVREQIETRRLARINKDKNFDGQFYFGVKTTRIFCRPSCSAPVAKEENVIYFDTIYQAMEQDYIPCYRCRPDLNTTAAIQFQGNPERQDTLVRAAGMIQKGYLNRHKLGELARELNISERRLRELFSRHLGTSPQKLGMYCRALLAKRLLMHSESPLRDIAYASGYNSIRQFNDQVKRFFGRTPGELRKKSEGANSAAFVFNIPLPPGYDFIKSLSFMSKRIIGGIESLEGGVYSRVFSLDSSKGFMKISLTGKSPSLQVEVLCDNLSCVMELHRQIRFMFDMDANLQLIADTMNRTDPILPVRSIPKAFSVYEFIIRAIIGQQISVKAATTITNRLVRAGAIPSGRDDLPFLFPEPEDVVELDISSIGLTRRQQETIKDVSRAIVDGELSLDRMQDQKQFIESFCSIKGIGEWTAHYVGMRAMGYGDCFPASDLGIIKMMEKYYKIKKTGDIKEFSRKWSPYRSYAAFGLWLLMEE